MGYMVHHAILVTSWDGTKLKNARAKALEIFSKHNDTARAIRFSGLVSPIMKGTSNGEDSFFIAPDGSKAGWDTSNDGDSARDEFVAYLHTQVYEDGSSALRWAEVQYGDDEGNDRVLRSSK